MIRIGQTEIEFRGDLTVSHLPGGLEVVAAPQDDPEYLGRAASLGYGIDTLAMSRAHEVGHSLLAHWLGLPESPTLRGVASGNYWEHWHSEECAVMAIQKMANMAGVDLIQRAKEISR